MTTIAGAIADDGTVVLGADTYGMLAERWIPGSVKVWAQPVAGPPGSVRQHVLVAAAGSGAAAASWRSHWTLTDVPGRDASDDQADAWARACAETLAEIAADSKPAPLTDGGSVDAVALLGFGGRLWMLAQQAANPLYRHRRFYAAGSGGDTALGALQMLQAPDAGRSAVAVAGWVDRAVRAAAEWDPWTHIDEQGPRVLCLDRRGQLA